MEKIIFTPTDQDESLNSKMVRIEGDMYKTISYISTRTGIPISKVVAMLIDKSLRTSEIESYDKAKDLLESYKQTKPKY